MSYVSSFLVGGALCVIAQILIDRTKLTAAKVLTGYVVLGVVLGALGVYSHIVDFAGCGATVPLTGFGNALFEGVKKAVDKDGAIGIITGGLSNTSAGISSAILLALAAAIIFKSKRK